MEETSKLAFRGGIFSAFIPLIIFCLGVLSLFVIWKGIDFIALSTLAFVGLVIGGILCKDFNEYWEAVAKGIADPISVSVLVILFVVGMFGALIKACDISSGFVWLAHSINLHGGMFAVFVFVATCIISTATGSSFAALFTGFPIFYPASILLGCEPSIMAGLILAGAIFGDNVAPISDTTILSASTQEFKNRKGTADIGGCVSTRVKYALVSAVISIVIYYFIAGGYSLGEGAEELLAKSMNAKSLIMLAPVALALYISIRTRNIFRAMTVGLTVGTAVALLFGILTPKDVFSVVNGTPGGFLYSGIKGMVGVVILIISMFGIMGVMKSAGAIDFVIEKMLSSRLANTSRGAEFMLGMTMTVVTTFMGGAQDPAILTMGPIFNRIGKEKNIHPYRRANLLDGFSNSLPVSIPFISCYIFLTVQLTQGYDFVEPLTALEVSKGMVYTVCLFFVLTVAVLTGWGRVFEGPAGEMIKANGAKV
ncbi:Na+/H+ antiporter NhaC-like protein [Denitrovibrio acetiphilus DSM 12809]|uniref:Na+/H+ antiporter NhaC-like protein n=1 Tax=Denitrovibrio acetiphilus (strain DSM 12809 / NBRC 114555 / N2460) TaxID=522772 RepID=D4H259_DENA2|nr:Na+/H+ antiporter NhaC family protein [Denitrovibrio acetiphilus]ADD68850.1 Na+/H+ antiporter NhaC-like protein [Denitrovibrio acetiphilus DSM 12809]